LDFLKANDKEASLGYLIRNELKKHVLYRNLKTQ